MASTGKLCAMVILVCILGPIATGFLMPAGESTHVGYEQGNPVNVTTDLYNNTEPYSATYSGFANNAYMIGGKLRMTMGPPYYAYNQPDYVETGSAAGPIRTYSSGMSSTTTLYNGGSPVDYTIPSGTFVDNGKLMIIDWDVSYSTPAVWKGISVDGEAIVGPTYGGILYDGGEYVRIGTEMYHKSSTFRLTGNGFSTVDAYYFDANGYASDSAGQYVPAAADTWTDGAMWTNYKDNTAADYIFRGTTYDVTVSPFTGASINLVRNGTAVYATLTYTSYEDNPDYSWDDLNPTKTVTNVSAKNVGNYRDVLLRLSYDSADNLIVSVAGLGYSAGISTNYENRIINLVELGSITHDLGRYAPVPAVPVDPDAPLPDPSYTEMYAPTYFDSVRIYATTSQAVIAYWASAQYLAGSYSIIADNTLTLTDYFPDVTSSAELRSISQYGTAVDLPNNANLTVTDGKITVTDIDGEQHTIPVRNLILLAVKNGATYDCYVDDIPIGTSAAPAIGLDGAWLLTAYVFKTSSYTYTTQDWVAGSFNLDEAGFCVVGLCCAFAAFIVAGLWGRKSGSKVLALMIIAAICGFVYFNLLLEV